MGLIGFEVVPLATVFAHQGFPIKQQHCTQTHSIQELVSICPDDVLLADERATKALLADEIYSVACL